MSDQGARCTNCDTTAVECQRIFRSSPDEARRWCCRACQYYGPVTSHTTTRPPDAPMSSAAADDITLTVLAMDRHHDHLAALRRLGLMDAAGLDAAISALRDFQDAAISRVLGEITQAQFEAAATVAQETLTNLQEDSNE